MSENNDLIKYIKNLTEETNAEDIKQYLLKYKESLNQNEANQTNQRSDHETNQTTLKNDIIVKNSVRISKIYDYYKDKLITKKQKEEVKDYLINNDYIKQKTNKNNRIVGYVVNNEKINEFNEWMKENLIQV